MQAESRNRRVDQADAIEWLAANPAPARASVVTSLPDVSEVPLDLDGWRSWFVDAARTVLRWLPEGGVALFYQSDIRLRGQLIDKGYLVMRAAEEERAFVLWHKIVCRKPPGTLAFGRPSYSHLIAVSAEARDDLRQVGPDVLPDGGEMSWSRAMGVEACLLACRYLRDQVGARVVVDPFCGRGTVLAAANSLGLDSIGVDLAAKRCRAARSFALPIEAPAPSNDPGLPHRFAFESGARLFDAGAYWDAHEAWEEHWRIETEPAERLFLQGMIQVAAALHKLHVMASPEAALRIFGRALAKLETWPADLDLARFILQVGEYRAALAAGSLGDRAVPRLGV